MKKNYLLIVLLAMVSIGFGQTTYTENFDTQANWAGGSMGGYNAKTYINDAVDPVGDVFSSDNAVRESSNVNSGSYAWRLKKANGVYLRYACTETVSGFSIYMARWDNSPTPHVDVNYSTNSGTTYTTIESIDGGTFFTGDKVYKLYSYTFPTAVSPDGASDSVFIEFVTTSGERMLYDDFELNYSSGSTSGPDNPTSLLATTISTSEIDLSWTRNSSLDSVMVVWSPDNTFGTPTDGSYYAVDDTIPGGDSVIFRGVDTTYAHISLTQGTQYYYKAFSLDASTAYSAGVTDDATTFKEEPSNHVSSFAAGTPTSAAIPLTWSDNDGTVVADSFLIMINTTGTFTDPVDGTPQADDLDVSDGSGVVNVAHGDESYTWTGLSQGTHYYFTIYPYTNSGSAIDYKTDGTIPSTDATTTGFTTTLPYSQTFDADLGDCNTFSVSGSTKEWSWNSTDQAAQMNGYNSGDLEEDWLFIPGINLDNYSNEIMTFDTWYNYGTDDADNYLKLVYSTDYPGTGDPTGYTWNELTFTHPSAAQTWTSSGDVDLSAITGTAVYIAFKYHYNSGSYRKWEVDNISINETTILPEPSNYPTDFAATTNSAIAITNTWIDATGTQVPSGYLILIKDNTGSFTTPVDGTPVSNDTDLSDGEGAMNVTNGTETYQWTGLSFATAYDFVIYPYTNSGSNIDYKTDGTAPTASATTNAANTNLIISEVSDPKDNANGRFVELYNTGSDTIFFNVDDWYLTKQVNGGNFYDIHIAADTLPPGEAYTIANKISYFNTAYGFDPNMANTNISGNGDDGYYLYYGGNHSSGTLIDAYGVLDEDGTGKAWEYLDGKAVRKRSVGSPNSTWTASEWVITRPADVVNMTPGQHFNYVSWQGTTDTDWDTKANWDNGFIPDVSMNVTIASSSNNPAIATTSFAQCWDLAVDASASLTIASDASGQGGLAVYGTETGNVSVKCYMTTAQWHGIAAPVSGQTANNLYMNGNPDVWLKYYNEADNTYSYITDLGTALGDMKGWMMWVDDVSSTLSDTTFTFTGSLRNGTVSPSESIVRTHTGADYGYNFVGNPFTSTIDWDDTNGWVKTNIDTAIYVYNNGNWATYANGTGANGGSQYIAMNQGFFVQVKDDGSTSATLTATNAVQVKHTSNFYKSNRADNDISLIRLDISAEGMHDETVVKLMPGATDGYDSQYDAHKLFSFNTNHPQIFSTANGKMSINTLPPETGSVAMDVTGKDGDMMTISMTEQTNVAEVLLVDEATDIQTDLTKNSYSFVYDNTITDRFTLHFGIVGVPSQNEKTNLFRIYSIGNLAFVMIPLNTRANIEVYNLLGQKIAQADNKSGLYSVSLRKGQYYIIKVYNNYGIETKKVLIK